MKRQNENRKKKELKIQPTIGDHKMIKTGAFGIAYKNEHILKVDSIM